MTVDSSGRCQTYGGLMTEDGFRPANGGRTCLRMGFEVYDDMSLIGLVVRSEDGCYTLIPSGTTQM